VCGGWRTSRRRWGYAGIGLDDQRLNQKIYRQIEEWRQRPLERRLSLRFPRWPVAEAELGGEVKNVSVLVAIGVAQTGYRQILE
jgi:transposase-like protein